jgi:hypothetical protein
MPAAQTVLIAEDEDNSSEFRCNGASAREFSSSLGATASTGSSILAQLPFLAYREMWKT